MPSAKEEKELEEKEAAARKELGTKGSENKATGTFVAGGFDWDSATPDPQLDIYELIRHVPTDRAKRLGEKTINGKRVVGFLVEQDERYRKQHHEVASHLVGRSNDEAARSIRNLLGNDDAKDSGSKVVSDIVFDAPLDPALFSIDVPAGYTDLGPAAKKATEEGQALAKNPNRMNTLQFAEIENMKTKDGQAAPELVKRVMILDNYLKREEVTIQAADKSAAAARWNCAARQHSRCEAGQNALFCCPRRRSSSTRRKRRSRLITFNWPSSKNNRQSARGKSMFTRRSDFPDKKSTRLPLKLIDGQLAFGKHVEQEVTAWQVSWIPASGRFGSIRSRCISSVAKAHCGAPTHRSAKSTMCCVTSLGIRAG